MLFLLSPLLVVVVYPPLPSLLPQFETTETFELPGSGRVAHRVPNLGVGPDEDECVRSGGGCPLHPHRIFFVV